MKFLHCAVCLAAMVLLASCTSTRPGITLNVRDFGAVGDGAANDRPAFVAALDRVKALAGEPVVLHVPNGTYRLEMPADADPRTAHLAISDISNLTVSASHRALLLCGSPYHHGIGVFRGRNVTLSHVAVDYNPLPFTQGIIVGANPEKQLLDVKIGDGFLPPTEPHLDAFSGKPGKNVGYLYDPITGRKLNGFYDQYLREQVVPLGNGVFRYKTSNRVESAMVGKRFVIVGRRKADAIKLHGTVRCHLDRIEVYSSPACGFNLQDCSEITLDHCVIKPLPDSTRVFSTNADGLHGKWGVIGPVLSNSYFTGMGDDAVNVGGSYVPIVEQPDDHTLIVEGHGSVNKLDAELVTVDLKTHAQIPLSPLREIRGTKVKGYDRPCLRLVFEKPLPAMATFMQTHKKKACSQVLNLKACERGAKIINNRFVNHRCRGVLMRAPDGVIRGNRFEYLAGPGVVISNDGGFLTEGPSGNGTVVEGNLFNHIERSNIWINSSVPGQTDAATHGIVGLRIVGNHFDNYGGPNCYGRGAVGTIFDISNAADCVIENNVIGEPSAEEFRGTPLRLKRTENIVWKNNTIEGRPLDLERDAKPVEK
jgi:hypothetical protein